MILDWFNIEEVLFAQELVSELNFEILYRIKNISNKCYRKRFNALLSILINNLMSVLCHIRKLAKFRFVY